jgi:peptidoglycan/LPS O-acetylase OafA/YrhL
MKALQRLLAGDERYPALTGVRACGASAVFLDHFPLWPQAHIVINVMAFFFVLSGFLITRLYHERVALSRAWLGGYAVNRFARIYPVYWLLLTVVVCLAPWQSTPVLFANYTLTHALFHGMPLLIVVSWTLTVEECFYFSAPFFMVLARRASFAAVLLAGAALLAAALAFSRLGFSLLQTWMFVLSETIFGHCAEFFAGMYLALRVTRLEALGGAAAAARWCTAAGVLGVTVLILAMAWIYHVGGFHPAVVTLINNFLIPVPIAILYLGLIHERSPLAWLLSTTPARLLGRASYSFYLLAAVVLAAVVPLTPAGGTARVLVVTVTFIGTWMVSILLFAFYEEPLNAIIRRLLRPPQRELARASSA